MSDSPTDSETVDQKQDRHNVIVSSLLNKFQDNDDGSITLSRLTIDSIWLLLELRVKGSRQKDLLEYIAGITAQLTPSPDQTNRFRVVVKVPDDSIPFYPIGSKRVPADRDILEKVDVLVTGILAHDKKLRGDLAVDTLKNNFNCDAILYLIILTYEKYEIERRDIIKKGNASAKELTAFWKEASATRTRRADGIAEVIDATWVPYKVADAILGCGEHIHEKALKLYRKAKKAYDDLLLKIAIVREQIDKNFRSTCAEIPFNPRYSALISDSAVRIYRLLEERFSQQFQYTTWEQTHLLCIIETLTLGQARVAAEELWKLVDNSGTYRHGNELAEITRDWIDTLLGRFIEIDPQLYDSIARHALSNFKSFCKICNDARCRIQQERVFEASEYLSWHIYWKVATIYATTTKETVDRLFRELFRQCFERPWIQEEEIEHCFTGANIYRVQSAVCRTFACQDKNYAPLVDSCTADLKAFQNGLNLRDAVQRKNNQAEEAAGTEANKVAIAFFHAEDPATDEKKLFIKGLLVIYQRLITVRKQRSLIQKNEADSPSWAANDIIVLNEALADLASTLVADRLKGGPKVSDSPAVYITVEALADFLTDQINESEKILESFPLTALAEVPEDEQFYRTGDDLCGTGLVRKLAQTYFEDKKTLGLVSADDSLRVFAEHVEGIAEEAPDCTETASGDEEESDAPLGLALSEESSEESDDLLDIDDEPEPQPLSPQHLQVHCSRGAFAEHFSEPSLYGHAILAAAGEGHGRNVRHCTGIANCDGLTHDDAFARELEQALDEDPLFDGFPSPESHDAVLRGALDGNSFDV